MQWYSGFANFTTINLDVKCYIETDLEDFYSSADFISNFVSMNLLS